MSKKVYYKWFLMWISITLPTQIKTNMQQKLQKLKLAIFILLISTQFVNSQSINNYQFATNANASLLRSFGSLTDDVDMTIGTSVLLGGSQITQNSAQVPIGFDFWANGQRFNTFNVTSNGWVGVGTFAGTTQGWLTTLASGIRLAPFLGPLITTTTPALGTIGTSSIGRVHYKTIGFAPSRVTIIEFLRMAINTSVVDDTTTFQVRLYEQTGAIEYVYGRVKVTAGAPINYNIGIQFPTSAYQSVNVSNNTSSTTTSTTNTINTNNTFIANLHSYFAGQQRVYRWQAPQPTVPSNLTFSGITNSTITLNWNDVADDFGYAIYRSVDGGNTYEYAGITGTNVTTFTVTGLPANTLVYFRVHARRESLGDGLDGSAQTLPGSQITSIKDGLWNDPTTWSSGIVPTQFDSVLVSAGDTVTVNINNAAAGTLEVNGTILYNQSTASSLIVKDKLTINASGIISAGLGTLQNHVLNLGVNNLTVAAGSIENNGILDLFTTAAVNATFAGTLNATITGNGFYEFANITLQKGNNFTNVDLNGTLEVFSVINFALPTTASRLTLSTGTFKISSASNLTPYPGNNAFAMISSLGSKIWVNHPNASLNTNATTATTVLSTTINGHLVLDAGTINIGGGNHNLVTSSSTRIFINGGTFNHRGAFTLANIINCSLVVTGGNLNITPQVGTTRTTSAAFSLQPSSIFFMSGGTITITDPNFNNANSIEIPINANKTMTGGTIALGDGLSNLPSSAPINISGFAISSAMPIHNLVINNRIDLSNLRQVRLSNDLTVTNNLNVAANGYLFLGSNNIGRTLTCNGSVINNGVIAGTFATGNSFLGNLSFDNQSTSLTFSGNGNLVNLNELSVNNPGGLVSFTNTTPWNVTRLNLISGNLNLGNNFTIGNTSNAPVIQIGGINEQLAAGSFNAVPTLNTSAGLLSLIYGPAAGTPTTGGFNEIAFGALNLAKLFVNDSQGLVVNRSLSVRDSLVLNGGNLNVGSNNISLGVSATNNGQLVRNSGFVELTTGLFTRWYANNQVIANSYNNGFPVSVNGFDRSVLLSSNALPINSGGSVSVSHAFGGIFIDLNTPYLDDNVFVNRRTLASWTLTQSGIVASGGLVLSVVGQGVGNITNVSNLRLVRSDDANAGSNVNGSGTTSLPIISRTFTSSTTAQLNNTFFVGVNSSENPLSPQFIAIANGNWNNPFSWNLTQVPTITNAVLIPPEITITNTASTPISCDSLSLEGTLTLNGDTFYVNKGILVNGTLNHNGGVTAINGTTQNGIIVSDGGTFSLSAGNIALGATGGSNRSLLVNGNLNLLNGNFAVNGNVLINNTATFNQSGGNLIIDGNSGTAATSVPQGIHHLSINSSNVNCSAGNITIIDPPHSSYFTGSTQSLRVTAAASLSMFSGTHTVVFGDGVSTTQGNTNGFNVDNRRSGVVPLQNVIVNAGSASGRWVSPSYSSGSFGMYVKGNITINTGSEVRHTSPSQFVIGGNITNNGTLTLAQPVILGGLGYVIATPQIIGGTGIFRNNATTPTANLTSLTLDNTGGATILSAATTISLSGNLNLTNGVLTLGNNIVKINQGGNVLRTNGYVNGTINRFVAAGSNVNVFYPTGTASGYAPVTLTIPSVSTAGELTLGSTPNDHPQIASSCLNATRSLNRFFTLTNAGVVGLTNYAASIAFNSNELDALANPIVFRAQLFNGSNWINTTIDNAQNNVLSISGLNGSGDIQIAELASTNTSVTIAATSTNICLGTSVTFTATPVNAGVNPSYQWRKNGINVGTNSNTYADGFLLNGDEVSVIITANLACGLVQVNSNTLVINVSTSSVKGVVGSNQNICTGSAPATLNLSGNNGTVVNWQFAVAPFSSWSNITNTATSFSPGVLSQTTAYRAITQNGGCTAVASDSAVITVLQNPTGGVVTGGSTVCSGTQAPTLTLNGHTNGNVIRWESSVSPFFVWTPISNTTTTLNPGAVTTTTRYRAVISNGACAPVTSTETTVNVQQAGTWLGLVSSDWNNTANWCGGIPTTTTDATIASGTPFSPQINTNAFCRDLVLLNNATLSFAGTTNSISISREAFLANNATFNPANGTVAFNGSGYQLIPALSYNNLTMSGPGFKEVSGNVTVNGTLTLLQGFVFLNNSNLTISASGLINGGSAASFVVINGFGRLNQNNIGATGKTGNILFPVGHNETNYNPVIINNTGTTDNFSVGILDGVYRSYSGETPTSLSYFEEAVGRTYIINEQTAGGSNLTLTLQWNAADELTNFTRNNCFVSRYNGTNWVPFGNTSASGSNPYSVTISGVTTTGLFGVGSNNTLPVSWVSFTGIYINNAIRLNWQTASEQSAAYFEVERSLDGVSFEPIGRVKAAGNSNSLLNYVFDDKQLISGINTYFYRLKQVDFNSDYNYSNTVKVSFGADELFEIVSVYPNPFTDNIVIKTNNNQAQSVKVTLLDMNGKQFVSGEFAVQNGLIEVSALHELAAGMYMMQITNNNQTATYKLIKQ